MRGILPLLIGACASLTSFHCRKPGCVFDEDAKNEDANRDIQCYDEVAAFLTSVSSILQELHFEQGVKQNMSRHLRHGTLKSALRLGAIRGRPASQELKTMDQRFVDRVLPVLERCRWPRLERAKIVGLGKGEGREPIDPVRLAGLREHVGCDVVVEDVSKRLCVGYKGRGAFVE